MAEVKQFQTIPIVAAGLTLSIDVTQFTDYLITGTGTLTGSVTITPTGTPAIGTVLTFKYEGNWVLGSNNITISGRVLNQQEASSKCVITCRWDDTLLTPAWVVDVEMSDNAQYVGKVLAESTDNAPGLLSAKIEDSIVIDATNHKIKLDGDSLTPADNTHYGKQGGVKTWYPDYIPLLPVGTTIYLGSLFQSSTNAPVPTTLVNTIGVIVGGTYIGVGVYTLNLPAVPDLTKVMVLTGAGLNDSNFLKVNVVSPGGIPKIAINTFDKTGTLADGLLENMPILILILP